MRNTLLNLLFLLLHQNIHGNRNNIKHITIIDSKFSKKTSKRKNNNSNNFKKRLFILIFVVIVAIVLILTIRNNNKNAIQDNNKDPTIDPDQEVKLREQFKIIEESIDDAYEYLDGCRQNITTKKEIEKEIEEIQNNYGFYIECYNICTKLDLQVSSIDEEENPYAQKGYEIYINKDTFKKLEKFYNCYDSYINLLYKKINSDDINDIQEKIEKKVEKTTNNIEKFQELEAQLLSDEGSKVELQEYKEITEIIKAQHTLYDKSAEETEYQEFKQISYTSHAVLKILNTALHNINIKDNFSNKEGLNSKSLQLVIFILETWCETWVNWKTVHKQIKPLFMTCSQKINEIFGENYRNIEIEKDLQDLSYATFWDKLNVRNSLINNFRRILISQSQIEDEK